MNTLLRRYFALVFPVPAATVRTHLLRLAGLPLMFLGLLLLLPGLLLGALVLLALGLLLLVGGAALILFLFRQTIGGLKPDPTYALVTTLAPLDVEKALRSTSAALLGSGMARRVRSWARADWAVWMLEILPGSANMYLKTTRPLARGFETLLRSADPALSFSEIEVPEFYQYPAAGHWDRAVSLGPRIPSASAPLDVAGLRRTLAGDEGVFLSWDLSSSARGLEGLGHLDILTGDQRRPEDQARAQEMFKQMAALMSAVFAEREGRFTLRATNTPTLFDVGALAGFWASGTRAAPRAVAPSVEQVALPSPVSPGVTLPPLPEPVPLAPLATASPPVAATPRPLMTTPLQVGVGVGGEAIIIAADAVRGRIFAAGEGAHYALATLAAQAWERYQQAWLVITDEPTAYDRLRAHPRIGETLTFLAVGTAYTPLALDVLAPLATEYAASRGATKTELVALSSRLALAFDGTSALTFQAAAETALHHAGSRQLTWEDIEIALEVLPNAFAEHDAVVQIMASPHLAVYRGLRLADLSGPCVITIDPTVPSSLRRLCLLEIALRFAAAPGSFAALVFDGIGTLAADASYAKALFALVSQVPLVSADAHPLRVADPWIRQSAMLLVYRLDAESEAIRLGSLIGQGQETQRSWLNLQAPGQLSTTGTYLPSEGVLVTPAGSRTFVTPAWIEQLTAPAARPVPTAVVRDSLPQYDWCGACPVVCEMPRRAWTLLGPHWDWYKYGAAVTPPAFLQYWAGLLANTTDLSTALAQTATLAAGNEPIAAGGAWRGLVFCLFASLLERLPEPFEREDARRFMDHVAAALPRVEPAALPTTLLAGDLAACAPALRRLLTGMTPEAVVVTPPSSPPLTTEMTPSPAAVPAVEPAVEPLFRAPRWTANIRRLYEQREP